MKLILLLFPLLAFSYVPADDHTTNTDLIRARNGSVVEMLSPLKGNSFTGLKAMETNAFGEMVESAVTATELNFLDGVTSNVQTQLDGKEDSLPLATNGDLLYYNTVMTALGIGTDGQLLTVSSGLPSWQDPPISTTLDTKGQLQGYSTVNANVGPCTDNQILVFDNLEATGWKCSDLPSTSPTTTAGDLIYNDGGGNASDTRLAVGTDGQLLTVVSGNPAWADAPVSTTLTTKGSLQGFSTVNAEVLVGNDGEFLVADSAQATGLKYTNTLQGKLNPVSDWEDFTPTGTWTTNVTYSGKYRRIGDSLEADIFININGQPDNITLQIDVPLSLSINVNKLASEGAGGSTIKVGDARYLDAGLAQAMGQVGFIDANTLRPILERVIGNNDTTNVTRTLPHTWASGDAIHLQIKIPIAGWNSGIDAVVQNMELTAETANEFNVKIGVGGVVEVDDYDIINGNCALSGTNNENKTCSFNTGIFTEYPLVLATSCSDAGGTGVDTNSAITFLSSSSFRLTTRSLVNVQVDRRTCLRVYKRGVDLNKSQTIVGNFEQIEEVTIPSDETNTNTLSAHIAAGGTVSNENVDWINGNCSFTSNRFQCTPNAGVFSATPNCVASYDGQNTYGADYRYSLSSPTNLQFVVTDKNGGTGGFNLPISIVCSKSNADISDIKGAIINTSTIPRAVREDQYSETEIEWGLWNGQQLYRRCFTNDTLRGVGTFTITTWDSNLNPKNISTYNSNVWYFASRISGSNSQLIFYEASTGGLKIQNAGVYNLQTGVSFCMDYTK